MKLPFYHVTIRWRDIWRSLSFEKPKEKLQTNLENYFNSKNIVLLASARQGIFYALQSLSLGPADEVMVPAFICSVVPEAVIRAGAKPVFCPRQQDGFAMDIAALEQLLSPKTRAVIATHTFGLPAHISELAAFCKKHQLVLIEDCVHSFGATYDKKLVGTFGDFAVFSFGVSKSFGGVGGGFMYCASQDNFQKIEKLHSLAKQYSPIKKYFEVIAMKLVFNLYGYWLLGSLAQKYAGYNGEKKDDQEYESLISTLEATIALNKLERYQKDMETRNANAVVYQQKLSQFFYFVTIPQNVIPAYPFLPVFASNEVFHFLKKHDMPVMRMDFKGFEKKEYDGYFLLPLNYSLQTIEQIADNIRQLLSLNHL